MLDSDFFSPRGKDIPSRFWSAYERMATQHDEELLDRHSNDMDVLLIFTGLFSAVASAFIVNLNSSLKPNPADTTNALLKILINRIDNDTFPDQDATLPVWMGPSSMVIWIQTLAFMCLSTSLLTAFGAVLCKQWLGYFKTSRFGRGSLEERCKRRQQKLDGLEMWHLSTIIATLPVFLQLSLLLFGIALAADIWTQQHTVASVIIGTMGLGVVFYTFTVVASLKSPQCPFQTPVSSILKDLCRGVMSKGKLASQADISSENLSNSPSALTTGQDLIVPIISRFTAYIIRITSTLRQRPRLPIDNPEPAFGSTFGSTGEPCTENVGLNLSCLDSKIEQIGWRSIQWVLETSTDIDIITAAVEMVPEVEWPGQDDITGVVDRLKSLLYSCFDSTRQILPLTQSRVSACLKAIYHLCFERSLARKPFRIYDGGIWSIEHTGVYPIPHDQEFLIISYAVDEIHEVDINVLSSSDRMWMAHVFTYRLQRGHYYPKLDTRVIDFISICLLDSTSARRLIADSLLLAGLLIGLRTEHRYLSRLDKSAAIPQLQGSVINRMLDVLLGKAAIMPSHAQNARNLLHPLFVYLDKYGNHDDSTDVNISIRCLKLSFRFLEEAKADSGNQALSKYMATALRLSHHYSPQTGAAQSWTFLHQFGSAPEWWYWLGSPDWHTPAQFDLLVDQLWQDCGDTDYTIIGDIFVALAGLRGSPSTPERKHIYIETAIRYMGLEIPLRTRHAAMNAICMIRSELALMGRDDDTIRNRFSQALTSTLLSRVNPAQEDGGVFSYSPYRDESFYDRERDLCYLKLLCTLAREPTWHDQLLQHGHFDNCLAIADMLSSRRGFGAHAVYITHVFATVDALGEEHKFWGAIQAYPIWPVILKAWRYIFRFHFFEYVTKKNLECITSTGYLEALSPLVAYATRHRERWDNTEGSRRLIQLVKQVRDKLDEEMELSEQDNEQMEHRQGDSSFGHRGIPHLGRQIQELLLLRTL